MTRMLKSFLLVCLMALLLAPVAQAEDIEVINTVEAFESKLLELQPQAPASFNIMCSEELFAQLNADEFASLYRMAYRSGMQQFRLRYSASGKLQFQQATWQSVISFAECETIADVEAALHDCLENGNDNITLLCGADVFKKVYSKGGMYHLMARLGVGDFDMAGTGTNACFISGMTPMTVPYACVESMSEAGEKISAWQASGATDFNLVFDEVTYAALTRDDYALIAFQGGLSKYRLSYSNNACMLMFTQAVYADMPGVYCTDEEQIVAAIRALGAQGITAFQIKMDEETYKTVSADSFARLHELEARAGMTDGRMGYSSSACLVKIEGATIIADASPLKTFEEAMAVVNENVAANAENISLLLTPELYAEMMDNAFSFGAGDAKFYDLIYNSGISTVDNFSFNRSSGSINLYGVHYYPSDNILRAVAQGDTSALADREQETLAAAQQMAAACARDTQTETALAIHDALCDTMAYLDDDVVDEGDNCVGALLNGQADCDGYSDAMYLVGRLAGLNVRRQHGDSVNDGIGGMFSTHMWNLIELDGTWRLIDVTWDDGNDIPCHLWFNIGQDRASLTHAWNAELSVPLLAETESAGRPAAEYFAATAEEVTAAAAAAQSVGAKEYDIFISKDSGLTKITAPLALREGISGSVSYLWVDAMNCLHVVPAN